MTKPFIIGITGGSGSGKTTFIRQLRETFKESEVCIISQDDFYRPREEQMVDNEGIKNFDLPKSINKKEYCKLLLLQLVKLNQLLLQGQIPYGFVIYYNS